MPYIGKNPVGGGFHKLDALTASATATYALTLNSAAYYPESANQLLVSLNGVIQAPQDSFTVSGSNLVFDTALTTSDSIDFVVALGDVLAVQTVTDGAITTAKLGNGAVTSAKLDTNIAVSGNLDVGTIRDAAGTNTAMTIASDGDLTVSNNLHLTGQPIFSARGRSATFSFSVSGQTGIKFNTIDVNRGNMYSTSTGQITIPETGIYRLSFTMGNAGTANNNLYVGLAIYLGTTRLTHGWVRNEGYDHTAHCEVIKELTSGDTITYTYNDAYGTPHSGDSELTATAVMIA